MNAPPRHAGPTRGHGRRRLVLGILLASLSALVWRAFDLQLEEREFLRGQGEARHLRVVTVPAHRGMITDRHGEPLAISTPVDSVWANPQELIVARDRLPELAGLLGLPVDGVQQLLAGRGDREFVYLRRHVAPDLAREVMALGLPGVALQREYRRYYPAGEVAGHVLGFTNIDDIGQEGIELAYDDHLRAEPGSKQVIKDRLGHVIDEVGSIRDPRPGHDLRLSLDRRIQYLAYRELKAAVQRYNASSATAVVLDVRTGEVLAMVNQPSFNPNNRRVLQGKNYRNRAVTDVFEPGSTLKPFTIAAALESGRYQPGTVIDTTPGWFQVGRLTVRDIRDFGPIDVATVITKSSNVGASKIALDLSGEEFWQVLDRVGFGAPTGSGLPGEVAGMLTSPRRWGPVEKATLSYGYGLSVTPLQLAQAYGVLANNGIRVPVSLLARDQQPAGERVLSQTTVSDLVRMMETVVSPVGTARRAAVTGYRVAGKTGTVKKSVAGGYSDNSYVAVFAGMAPASRPRLVTVVMVNEPRGKEYYGGLVAAPAFARIMAGALRLMNITPDDPAAWQAGDADSKRDGAT
ncbi:MAG: penicillin-binding protein 2 [Gammaproteobacteria bacterium]|nr:MAG: penicillin-binding protein 2 [Gammaproteobacteria bacterium]